MTELHVFVFIGCRECGAPSNLLAVGSPDAVRRRWNEETAAHRDSRGPLPYEVRDYDYGDEWPDNVVALNSGGDHAFVVYRAEEVLTDA